MDQGRSRVDPYTAPWLVAVAESGCRYFAELACPDPLAVGLGVITFRVTDFKLARSVQAYLLQQWVISARFTWTA